MKSKTLPLSRHPSKIKIRPSNQIRKSLKMFSNQRMRGISLNGRALRNQNQNSSPLTIVKVTKMIKVVKVGRQIKSEEEVAQLPRALAMEKTGTMGSSTRIPTRT